MHYEKNETRQNRRYLLLCIFAYNRYCNMDYRDTLLYKLAFLGKGST